MAARRMMILWIVAMVFCACIAPGAEAAAVKYAYDGAGRLVRASAGAGASAAYTYDAVGNREALNYLSFEPLLAMASLHLVVRAR